MKITEQEYLTLLPETCHDDPLLDRNMFGLVSSFNNWYRIITGNLIKSYYDDFDGFVSGNDDVNSVWFANFALQAACKIGELSFVKMALKKRSM